jgi:hypothetical protein
VGTRFDEFGVREKREGTSPRFNVDFEAILGEFPHNGRNHGNAALTGNHFFGHK